MGRLIFPAMTNFKNFIAGEWVAPADRRRTSRTESRRHDRPDRSLSPVGRARTWSARWRVGQARLRALAPHAGPGARRRAAPRRRPPGRAQGGARRPMTREMGKPLAETRGDVQEGIDTAYYAATEGRRLFGHTVPSELREQVGDELPPPDRRRGHHHAVQLPAGDPDVEDVPGAALRQRGGLQAGRGRAAHRARARRDPARGRAAARGDPARARHGRTVGAALVEHPGRAA